MDRSVASSLDKRTLMHARVPWTSLVRLAKHLEIRVRKGPWTLRRRTNLVERILVRIRELRDDDRATHAGQGLGGAEVRERQRPKALGGIPKQ